ncbi:flavodoxin 2 [Yersinia pestis Pestoides F]|uniref:Flavodoxin n=11 Tax=Yersinia pseudotuberculosis complex TaxID=1649845 RepID=Q8CZW4_YERPE|nr:flavodoxin 2 [Yersinia pestis KIM10+]AAS63740.1 flavodoxin 2 [Yersinia pestis biovar Microtus str. 91001]ABG12344.1 flavodoxin 2 [Yersinia pestis Antiqua]ABG19419.1 flavodoxin 2 [Yersinia pestis Nepal516]ABP39032.1 flavodoxin 2 [Yersinia pestis Pestoides F]
MTGQIWYTRCYSLLAMLRLYIMKIGLFYGSSTCYTEMVAEKIRDILGEDLVDLHNLKEVSPRLMEEYSILILGIPTWDFGELQEDWEAIWPQLTQLNLKGKIVAMYGMGDQFGYSEWFLDALGMLHDHIAPLGVKFIGFWPTDGFEFTSPKPLSADGKQFVGLALDEVNQYDLSEERIEQWCEQILLEMEALL